MNTGLQKLGFFSRLGAAFSLMTKGTMADVVEHFRRAKLGAHGGSGRPGKPYQQVAPVRTAISRKAMCLASMPLMLSTPDDHIIESGPLYDLVEKPNKRMSRRQFWISTCAWLDLTGACHWVMEKKTWRGIVPTEVIPVGAWQMKPVVTADAELAGWKYRPVGKRWDQAIELGLDEVWTVGLSNFDPDDPFGFSSPLESAGLAVSQIYKADLANEASLDNGVEPGGVLTMEGTPTEGQITDLRQQIAERHQGVANRRRHMLLYGGIKWERLAASFDEMEFSVLQKMKIVDVCVALDVDPASIGYYENSNYAHAESAKASMWIDTCIPRGEWLADEFERGIIARFAGDQSMTGGDRMREAAGKARALDVRRRSSMGFRRAKAGASDRTIVAWFDDSRIPAVRKAQLERSKEGAIWIDKYLCPPADAMEALDLPLPIHPHQRTARQPMGLMPVDAPVPGDEDPKDPPLPGEVDDADETAEKPGDTGDEDAVEQASIEVMRELTDDHLAKLWQLWRTSWSGLERAMLSKVSRHFMELRSETLRKLEEVKPGVDAGTKAIVIRTIIGQILFDITAANNKLAANVRPLVRESFHLGGQQSMDEAAIAEGKEAKESDPFNIDDKEAVEAMRRREVKITDANRTLRKRLANQLAEGIEKGETTAEIAERVRSEFNYAGSRAATIARTEIGAAVEESRQLGRNQAKVPGKSWLWSRKETGRPWHQETEDKTMKSPIANDEDFTIAQTGNLAPHPRGSGVAEDDINCGCTTLARYPDDKLRDLRLIRHLKAHGFTSHEELSSRKDAA